MGVKIVGINRNGKRGIWQAYKPDLRVYENEIPLYRNEERGEIRREDNHTRQYHTNEGNILLVSM